jgi:hypothetical protein
LPAAALHFAMDWGNVSENRRLMGQTRSISNPVIDTGFVRGR